MSKKKKRQKKTKLVYLEWEDSCGSTGRWTLIEEMKPDQPIHKSIGWIVFENSRWVIIVPHISSTPEHETVAYTGQGQMTIPKSAILKKVRVRLTF